MSYLFNCYAGIYDYFMKLWHLDDTSIIEQMLQGHCYDILDIGGGSGTLGDRLVKQGHDVTILDASLPMLKQAHQKNKQLHLIHVMLQEMPNLKLVDVIICRDCFHHLDNQDASLQAMLGYLKDDGFILIHDFDPKVGKIKLLFLFERCCFEKIKPVDLDYLNKLAQINQAALTVIHQGKWDYVCKIQKRR